jgi:hypothetical protein
LTVDPAQFFAASRLVIVAGKGGVGKTTVTAALARAAASTGMSTLIVEVEGKSGLASAFGREPLTYDEVELAPGIRGRTLTPDDALLEYLRDHGMARVSRRLMSSGALDIVSTAAPVNELIDTAFHLEDRVGVNLGPVVVNGLYEDVPGLSADPAVAAASASTTLRDGEAESLRAAASFRSHRMELQRDQVARLAAGLPLPQLHLPYLFNADIGPSDVEALAHSLLDGIGALQEARR